MRLLFLGAAIAVLAGEAALADATVEPHTIVVAGQAVLMIPPDFATIELGVISQAPLVGDALADNSARMTRVIDAMKALGIPDKDVRTSTFVIEPKFEKSESGDYDAQRFRTIVGYYISNKVSVRVRNLANVAKIIDESVKAGANASGNVGFEIDALTQHMDEVRQKAIEDARHKAQVFADAAHMKLGPALSIVDNQSDTSYDGQSRGYYGYNALESVVVTGSRLPTPIEPGLVTLTSKVTVVYATR